MNTSTITSDRIVGTGLAVVESRMAAPTGAADVELRRPAGHQVGEALAGEVDVASE